MLYVNLLRVQSVKQILLGKEPIRNRQKKGIRILDSYKLKTKSMKSDNRSNSLDSLLVGATADLIHSFCFLLNHFPFCLKIYKNLFFSRSAN